MVGDSPVENRQRLIQFISTELPSLNGILRVYLQKAGLTWDEDTTSELLNSLVVEALSHAQRYDPARPPRAWLLGIAANLVRRRQVESLRLNQREPLVSDLITESQESLGEDELFDLLATYSSRNPGQDLSRETEERDGLSTVLALLSLNEQKVILMFAQDSLDGDALAASLRMTPGAVRVRLHRALAHLRRMWFLTEEKKAHD